MILQIDSLDLFYGDAQALAPSLIPPPLAGEGRVGAKEAL